jgi:hypothetical protein
MTPTCVERWALTIGRPSVATGRCIVVMSLWSDETMCGAREDLERPSCAALGERNMPTGILVSVKTSNPGAYLSGIILFLLLGIVLAIVGFSGVAGGPGTGIVGVVLAVGAGALLVEYLGTR